MHPCADRERHASPPRAPCDRTQPPTPMPMAPVTPAGPNQQHATTSAAAAPEQHSPPPGCRPLLPNSGPHRRPDHRPCPSPHRDAAHRSGGCRAPAPERSGPTAPYRAATARAAPAAHPAPDPPMAQSGRCAGSAAPGLAAGAARCRRSRHRPDPLAKRLAVGAWPRPATMD